MSQAAHEYDETMIAETPEDEAMVEAAPEKMCRRA